MSIKRVRTCKVREILNVSLKFDIDIIYRPVCVCLSRSLDGDYKWFPLKCNYIFIKHEPFLYILYRVMKELAYLVIIAQIMPPYLSKCRMSN